MYKYSYYLQTNIFCIIILLLILIKLKNKTKYSTMIFKSILIHSILFCTCDIISIIFRGSKFHFTKTTLLISNSFYLLFPLIIGYYWINYIYINLDKNALNKKSINLIHILPLLIGIIMLILNIFNHNIFNIDNNNIYVRGKLFYVYIFISWSYIIFSTIKSIIYYKKSNNINKKEQIFPLCLFIIAPAITSIIQNIFYGLSINQIGFTLSALFIFLYYLDEQISIDNLTKINNRTKFNEYIQYKYDNTKDNETISLMFIDVNKFKLINDTYGHLIGDEVLINIANILKKTCSSFNKDLFLARYGGDEFVIVSSLDKKNMEYLKNNINKNVEIFNLNSKYKISLGIGFTSDKKCKYNSFHSMIVKADNLMYKTKNNN